MLNPDKTVSYFASRILGVYLPDDEPKIRIAVEKINEVFPDATGRVGRIPVSTIIWFISGGFSYGARIEPFKFLYDVYSNEKDANPPWCYSQHDGEIFFNQPMTPDSFQYRAPKQSKAGKKKGQIIAEEQQAAKEEDEAMQDVMTVSNKKGQQGGMF